MKKYFLLALGSLLAATFSLAQTSTERFESEIDENTTFVDNGVLFNIVSNTGRFFIQTSYPNTGWSGTGVDNAYIDNSGTFNGPQDPNAVANSSLSVKTTSNLFKVNRFWLYLAAVNANNQKVTGTLTVTGKSKGAIRFTQTRSTGFVDTTAITNGYTLIDLTNLNGQNYTGVVIDELQLTVGGDYRYMAVDAFTWVKDATVLPVTFGSVNASVKNKTVSVNWTTKKETANDYFEIEASKDGQQFTKIATVASKATNGNSDVTIDYEWSSKAALPLAAVSLIALAFTPFMNMRRKKTWMLALTLLGVGAFSVTGCSKSGDSINNNQSYYIRVAQVDKDGTKTFSKVVKVQQDH